MPKETMIEAVKVDSQIVFVPLFWFVARDRESSRWAALVLTGEGERGGFETYDEAERICDRYANPPDDMQSARWDSELRDWVDVELRYEPSSDNDREDFHSDI